MKNLLRRALQFIGVILMLMLLYVLGTLLLGTLNDFQPEDEIPLDTAGDASAATIRDSRLQFMVWNIGFAGLGKESDFFMVEKGVFWSGEKQVRFDKKYIDKNLEGIKKNIAATDADFFMLQEVDANSKRSYYIDQVAAIGALKPKHVYTFAHNYNIPRNPIPFLQPWKPYGKVESGLLTLSRYQPYEAVRYQLPGEFSWPQRIFHLDRCVAVHRFTTDFEGDLIIMNIHNSAFDNGGVLKKKQMDFIRDLAINAYEQGNYVVIGGDWNMVPPDFPTNYFHPELPEKPEYAISNQLMPNNWQWVYDSSAPTIRRTNHSYDPATTLTSLIDFYLVSPNLTIDSIKTLHLDFEYSDHQPVLLTVNLSKKQF